MTSLKEIAEKAGVSIRTVARVLHGAGSVAKLTRKKVESVVSELGYQPNLIARSLKTGVSSDVVAIIGTHDELHIDKLVSFERRMRDFAHRVNVIFVPKKGVDREFVSHMKLLRPAGAAIFSGVNKFPIDLFDGVFPFLGVGIKDSRLLCVDVDRRKGIEDAVAYLYDKGHRKIAYLGPADKSSFERLEGYKKSIKIYGLPKMIYSDRRELLKKAGNPTAVIVFSDVWAMELIRCFRANGISVPHDMAVIGFDDRSFAKLADPPLTTLAQPNFEIGELSAELLYDAIKRKAANSCKTILLPMRLKIRKSA